MLIGQHSMAVTNDYIFVWKINERPVSNKYQSKYITEIKDIGCKKIVQEIDEKYECKWLFQI